MSVDFNIVGKRLRNARKRKGLTQEELCEMIGVSIAYLSKIETAKAHINLQRLSQICDILGVTEGEILNGFPSKSDGSLSSELCNLLKDVPLEKQTLAYEILQVILNRD